MSVTKRRLTGKGPLHLWRHTEELFILESLGLIILCASWPSSRVVDAGFTRSYRLHEGNRFVVIATVTNIL